MNRINTQRIFKFDHAQLDYSLVVNTGVLEDYKNADVYFNKAEMDSANQQIKVTLSGSDN